MRHCHVHHVCLDHAKPFNALMESPCTCPAPAEEAGR